MQWRKPCRFFGLMLLWLAVGEAPFVCAQTPELAWFYFARPGLSQPSLSASEGLFDALRWRSGSDFFAGGEPVRTNFYGPFLQKDALCEAPLIFDDVSLYKIETLPMDAPPPSKSPRLVLFRMPSGFISAPLGLENEDETPPGGGDDDWNFVQVNLGRHIPYLDMFRRGDPGGVGYYKLHTQVQLFDSGSSSLCLGLQAYTPAGQSSNGELMNGPTTVIPAVSCFQEIYEGTALHGYISAQPVNANGHWRDSLSGGFRCGLALQQPIPLLPANAEQGLFVFVQTLGECRPDTLRGDVKATTWEFIPGVQWRCNSSCWMSLGISRFNMLTCAWQF